jgi:hypothetical protein
VTPATDKCSFLWQLTVGTHERRSNFGHQDGPTGSDYRDCDLVWLVLRTTLEFPAFRLVAILTVASSPPYSQGKSGESIAEGGLGMTIHSAFRPATREECEGFQMLAFGLCCATCGKTDAECPFGRHDSTCSDSAYPTAKSTLPSGHILQLVA